MKSSSKEKFKIASVVSHYSCYSYVNIRPSLMRLDLFCKQIGLTVIIFNRSERVVVERRRCLVKKYKTSLGISGSIHVHCL